MTSTSPKTPSATATHLAHHSDREPGGPGDFDADPDAASSANPNAPGDTLTPENPLVADPDWPFRRIDYILVRCGEHGGPTLPITNCRRTFDQPADGVWVSDPFGLVADLED